MSDIVRSLDDKLAGVVERVRPSLVQIRSGCHSGGAGTVWHSQGLIVSNVHVVQSGPLSVTLADSRTLPARLLAKDDQLDVAALAVSAAGLATIDLGESKTLQPGQLVLALGHPWGAIGAAAMGVVIGTGSGLAGLPTMEREWIATSLSLRPGNSGGPLFDVEGRLVGINAMITGPTVGMAVPVHVVKTFLGEALGSERKAKSAVG